MLKKIIPVLLGMIFMFTLFGCGTAKYTPESENTDYGFHSDDPDDPSSGEIVEEVTGEIVEEVTEEIVAEVTEGILKWKMQVPLSCH